METCADLRQRLVQEMPALRARYHVETLGLFGSFARDEQGPVSDVDLLVTFSETPDLLTFVNLKHYLEEVLGRPVDLGMPEGLKEAVRRRVLREVQYV